MEKLIKKSNIINDNNKESAATALLASMRSQRQDAADASNDSFAWEINKLKDSLGVSSGEQKIG